MQSCQTVYGSPFSSHRAHTSERTEAEGEDPHMEEAVCQFVERLNGTETNTIRLNSLE